MKHSRLIMIAFSLISVIVIIFAVNDKKQKVRKSIQAGLKKEYSGIVEEVRYIEGRRGMPEIRINKNWHQLGIGGEVEASYVLKTGDSIVKKVNELDVYLYRKDISGQWQMRYFKSRY